MPTNYSSSSFNFHSPSEHTVDGIHYDLELQLLSESDEGKSKNYSDSAISILFSVNSSNVEDITPIDSKIINSFFSSL